MLDGEKKQLVLTPRDVHAHWCRHIYRHWNKDSDARANRAILQARFETWIHPEATELAKGAILMGSFDGAYKHATMEGGAGWHLWVHEPGDQWRLLACGQRYLLNTTSVLAELTALADLTGHWKQVL